MTLNFYDQLLESNLKRNLFIKPINKVIPDITELKFKDDKTAQFDYGSDGYYKLKNGRKYSVEFKTTNFYDSVILEIKHLYYEDEKCTVFKGSKEGWLYCSTADQIFYGCYNEDKTNFKRVIGFSITPFKNKDFAAQLSNLDKRFSKVTKYSNNRYQKTIFVITPINYLKNNADWFVDWKQENNKVKEVKLNEWFK